MRKYLYLLFVILLPSTRIAVSASTNVWLISSAIVQEGNAANISGETQDVSTIAFCEPISSPAKYEAKIVRVKASLYQNFETAYLYDFGCISRDNLVYPILDCKDDASCRDLQNTLGLGQDLEIVMVGRFLWSGPSNKRFGQEQRRVAFSLSRIEQCVRITDGRRPWEKLEPRKTP